MRASRVLGAVLAFAITAMALALIVSGCLLGDVVPRPQRGLDFTAGVELEYSIDAPEGTDPRDADRVIPPRAIAATITRSSLL